MNASLPHATDARPVWQRGALWQSLRAAPHAHDFFHALRWLDARAGAVTPIGRSARPQDEPLRLGQRASLSFAPSMVAGLREVDGQLPHLSIYGFGLFGPNGPLPLHMTEYARERERFADDPTLTAFADLFHHRLIGLFYRAWADAQSTASLDRPGVSRFDHYIATLLALPDASTDVLGSHARYYQAGHLARQTRNPEGLVQILTRYFQVPVQLQEHVAHWVRLAPDDCLALGSHNPASGLGMGAALGVAVRDAQSRFRLVLGPLTAAQYRDFLPGGQHVAALQRWVHDYVGLELTWDVQLILAAPEVPPGQLSQPQALGLSGWLGRRTEDARDLILDYKHARQPARRSPHKEHHV